MNYGLRIGVNNHVTEETTEVKNKFTGETIGHISVASKEDIKHAIKIAYETFQVDSLSPYKRYEILKRASDLVKERKETLADVLAKEVGKPIREARVEVDRAIQTLMLSAEEAKRVGGEVIPLSASPDSENKFGFYIRVPVGVVCAITPFNVPLNLACHKLGPAIAAGNTIVWKPSSDTPINAHMLFDILVEAGLPAGYLNLVTGPGSKVGNWLLEDKRIDKYTFTGGPKVGMFIKEKSGFRNVSLELGNNSPNIVCKDANIEKAATSLAKWGLSNAGQACISAQRIYVHQEVMGSFQRILIEEVKKVKMGNPLDEETGIGPLISKAEADRIKSWIDEAVAEGAELLVGGKQDGAFIEPTVISKANAKMKVVCEEIFGPVMILLPFIDIDEAITAANNSDYGLQSGIYTSSIDTAMYAVKKLHTGGVIINDGSTYRADLMPYGGVKNSGIGREGPKFTMDEMTEIKTVVMNL
ncbi:aldehyde dehydrogenase [Salipaludibacillus keqinensis]|uniref:3-sulfolactaldehyde dehydrogenase n=1 Tax=Salipaludibacillus keqinensis TaxID=2045207 RepID=A0A323TGE8_9BACI|nr:aldehyde dehydrogenase family protein [Salipaludibacillus keqinensis]PYZ93346.1 aldehyde dehydrogenase [Salipaludibacillus keqinensis]